jgi:hypothetical protein
MGWLVNDVALFLFIQLFEVLCKPTVFNMKQYSGELIKFSEIYSISITFWFVKVVNIISKLITQFFK